MLLALLISTAISARKRRAQAPGIAREHAEKALALLDSQTAPASSWTDTEAYRGEIRHDAQKTLQKLSEKQG